MDKVLIVDDDAQLLLILSEALSKYSGKFKIKTVRDGLAAIKALQKEHFSLVVTDIHMPKVNGLVLLAYMARNFPKTPCIVMTGYGTPGLEKRMARDSLYYMTKPFKLPEMAEAIISHLDQHVMLGGTLTGVSVTGFLKLVEMECITCLCEIKSAEGGKGYLFFNGGTPYNAFYGELRGEEAAIRLLGMKGATIRYKKPPEQKIKRQILKSLSALLAEAEAA
ncbi:MAG: response regulator [Thermodesulfobacteriota bacterium]